MGTEKFIAFKEDGTAYRLKGRILRFLDNEPVSEDEKTNIRSTLSVPASGEGLTPANNLSDLSNVATARTNLSVNSKDEDAQAYALKTTAPALYFNGTSSLVTVADDDKLSFTDGVDDLPFSVSVCVRFFELGDAGGIIGKQDNTARGEWGLMLTSSGYFSFRCWTAGNLSNYINVNTTGPFNPGQWYHVLGTYDGSGNASGLKLYVNAVDESDTPTEVGTYAGMSNTSSPVWVGAQQNQGFFQGSIRDVKIFNRTLTAAEVAELARGNDLGFADEWGGALGGVYTQDATPSGEWTAFQGSVTDEAGPVGGVSNVLKYTSNTTSAEHYAYVGGLTTVGKRYRAKGFIYIPSAQSNIDGFRINNGSSVLQTFASPTLNAWVSFDVEFVATAATLIVYALDGGATTFADAGGDDILRTHSVTVTEIGTLADFRAENYDSDTGKIYDISDNAFVGTGTSVSLTGREQPVYSTGTWTPSITFGGGSTGVTYTTQEGYYTRIGNIVHISCSVTLSNKGTDTGGMKITGIPFTASNLTDSQNSLSVGFVANMSGLTSALTALMGENTTNISLYDWGATGGAEITEANATNTTTIRMSGTYQIQ